MVVGARAAKKLSLTDRALGLLAQREQSAAELRRKLLRHAQADAGHDETNAADDAAARVEAVIDWLRTHRYLSEERFVEGRVHARSGRYGNLRIRQELAQHGLALDPQAEASLKASELQRAAEVWRRRFGAAPVDAAEQAKQARFLSRRGFSPDVVSRLLRSTRRGSGGRHDEDDGAGA